MRLINAYAVRCDRDDFDTYADYSKAFDAIDDAPTIDAEPVIRCKDCKWHKEKRCTVWRERAVIVECYTDDDGFCYKGEPK